MSVAAYILLACGAGLPLLVLGVYPLLLRLLTVFAPRRQTTVAAPPPAYRLLDDEASAGHRLAEDGTVVVLPGRGGRLTSGGIRRLVAPLADPRVGLVVGRLLAPTIEEEGRLGGRKGGLAWAETLHRGWNHRLARREARLGTPASLAGAPCAVRTEFLTPEGVDLATLGRSGLRTRFLAGRRALVGRLELPPDLEILATALVAERRRDLRQWLRRPFQPAALVRVGLASLVPLALPLLLTGGTLALAAGASLAGKLALLAVVIFALGTMIGGLVYNLGFRSRLYFPCFFLAQELSVSLRALSGRPRPER